MPVIEVNGFDMYFEERVGLRGRDVQERLGAETHPDRLHLARAETIQEREHVTRALPEREWL